MFCCPRIVLLRSVFQFIFTFGLAFLIYYTVVSFTAQKDYNNEYFRFGSSSDDELSKSNEFRVKIAEGYLENASISDFKANQKTSLTIAVVASYRNNQSYLTQTIGYFVHHFRAQQYRLIVCFVEARPNEEIEKLQKIGFEFVFVFQNLTFAGNTQDRRISKEAHDYWTCLNRSNNLAKSEYILMLEDDTLPMPNTEKQVQSLIDQLNGHDRRRTVDYVKLFHPWYLRKLPSYVHIASACLFISILPVFMFNALRSSPAYCLNALMASFILSCVIILHNPKLPSDFRFALTGSAYMSFPESCCTPAVLFRSSSIPAIVKQLSKVLTKSGHAKDHVLDGSSFIGRLTDRNLIIHVGHISSIRQTRVNITQ